MALPLTCIAEVANRVTDMYLERKERHPMGSLHTCYSRTQGGFPGCRGACDTIYEYMHASHNAYGILSDLAQVSSSLGSKAIFQHTRGMQGDSVGPTGRPVQASTVPQACE